ncbi:MAG: DedA family protein [Candidatus Moraniibacteriota bacterium]
MPNLFFVFLNFSQTQIIDLLLHYKYLIFFPLVVIEGPIVTVIAGFLAFLGYFDLRVLYIVALMGDLVGDTLYYSIGYFGGKRIFSRGHFFWIKIEQVQKLKNHFSKHLGKTLLFAKWTHSMGALILIAAGMAKVSWKKFIGFNFIGTVPKTLAFLLIGYYFGRAYARIDTYLSYITIAVFFSIILVWGIYFFITKWNKSRV